MPCLTRRRLGDLHPKPQAIESGGLAAGSSGDNGSTDGSQVSAKELGARMVQVAAEGYAAH